MPGLDFPSQPLRWTHDVLDGWGGALKMAPASAIGPTTARASATATRTIRIRRLIGINLLTTYGLTVPSFTPESVERNYSLRRAAAVSTPKRRLVARVPDVALLGQLPAGGGEMGPDGLGIVILVIDQVEAQAHKLEQAVGALDVAVAERPRLHKRPHLGQKRVQGPR